MAPRVFFITGTSTGFGYELAKVVLSKGDHLVATARNSSKLDFSEAGATSSNTLYTDLDVTSKSAIDAAFDAALKKFGQVDVVVNNAGYGLCGEFESLSEEQIRTQMEINFFGLISVTKKAMEVMRDSKKGGVIQQITSIGGQRGVPTFSIYCASKWAVEGFTEAISKEVKPEWGIKFTCIEPGGFRTDWAGRSMLFGSNKNKAYDHIDAKADMEKRNGKQAGDPAKAAKAWYDLAVMKDPPLRVVVGTDAYAGMEEKLKTYKENMEKYKDLSNSTDVDGYQKPS